MVFIRTGLSDIHTIYTNNITDTALDGEFNSLVVYMTFSPNAALREWYNLFETAVILDQWNIFVLTNSNASDGAVFVSRIGGVDQPMEIIIDQATGRFLNTQSLTVNPLAQCNYRYDEGSVGGVPNTRTQGIRLNKTRFNS